MLQLVSFPRMHQHQREGRISRARLLTGTLVTAQVFVGSSVYHITWGANLLPQPWGRQWHTRSCPTRSVGKFMTFSVHVSSQVASLSLMPIKPRLGWQRIYESTSGVVLCAQRLSRTRGRCPCWSSPLGRGHNRRNVAAMSVLDSGLLT